MLSNPMYRALRCDKFTLSILEETLRTYFTPTEFSNKNLTLHLLTRSKENINQIGKNILAGIEDTKENILEITIVESQVEAGSGSLPTEEFPSFALQFNTINVSAERLAKKFRNSDPPVLGFIHEKRFRIDLKTIYGDQETQLIQVINKLEL